MREIGTLICWATAEAELSADGLLQTDGTEQVAAMVAGENKIIVEGSLPSKEEVKRKYGR